MATHKQRLFKKYDIPKDSSFSVEELAKFFKIPKKKKASLRTLL